MPLTIVGLNHQTAPVELRERLNFSRDELPAALEALVRRREVAEGLILSTCNRVEVVTRGAEGAELPPLLVDFLGEQRGIARTQFKPHLYVHQGRAAVRHLLRVAASLDSLVVGEPQILGQVKEAFATARGAGSVGGVLEFILTRALAVAKKVRAETGLGAGAVSVSSAAVELARKIFGSLEKRTVFLLGAGEMSELTARHLRESGAHTVFVSNRTHERARELAERLCGQAIRYDDLLAHVAQADIVIASTAAPHYILRREHVVAFLAERKNRSMFFIDISVPRNLEPAINDLDNAFLYDIDDLGQVVEANLRERRREAVQAEDIVERETDRLLAQLKTLELGPTIAALQQKLDAIREAEWAKARSKLGTLTPEQAAAVEQMTRTMVNKILHLPISQLKSLTQEPDGLKLVELLRKTFQLKD
ncbi:MAG: glutamyl-tRNA reductase [Terriglobia bacterium]